jgi:hypothetical protein
MLVLQMRQLLTPIPPVFLAEVPEKEALVESEMTEQQVTLAPRAKVLEALRWEPFLATYQVARLFYSVRRDGQAARSTRIRPKKTSNAIYELEPGYFPASKLLRAMLKDDELVRHQINQPGAVALWSKKGVRPPRNWFNRQHEIDCADVFCALAKTGRLAYWDTQWSPSEYNEALKRHGVSYDRRFELKGSDFVYFLEVDRGTEDVSIIAEKARRYAKLADQNRQPFRVIFTLQSYRGSDLAKRSRQLLQFGIHKAHHNWIFFLCSHQAFLEDPLGLVCVPASDSTKRVSLLPTP